MSHKDQFKKNPKIFIHPAYPIFMEGVFRYAKQQEIKIIFNEKVGDAVDLPKLRKKMGLIEISDNVAVLLISKASLPNEIADFGEFKNFLLGFSESYASPIIILQGYPKCLEGKDPKICLAIRGTFMKLFLDEGVGVLPTRSLLDTALCLRSVAKRVQIIDKPPSLARIKPKFPKLIDAQRFFLEGLMVSGPKTAINLSDNFESVFNVIKGIQESEVFFTKTGNPKGVIGPIEDIEGSSIKFVHQNKIMLFDEL
uniref:Uncharacterized protein n=1 Tax=Promethearchaeum syntrophicum TaxID=2594042 RepID=A0A5B9DF23_9ARCH|nr:hypothetical protein [Candidatus Prometheoarchaeum syntrophicum]QEE17734.1 hypothetical protein DSAG12_03572 [Candidatus Prometheoarchaeum syntrophicum]